jgi:hypothetical protein
MRVRMAMWQQRCPQISWSTRSGDLERITVRGPRWWTFSSSKVASISQRCAYARASSTAGASSGSRIVVNNR